MLMPGMLDFIICVSSHDVNDGEGELPAAAGSIISMSIATTARANGIGMNSPDPKDNVASFGDCLHGHRLTAGAHTPSRRKPANACRGGDRPLNTCIFLKLRRQ